VGLLTPSGLVLSAALRQARRKPGGSHPEHVGRVIMRLSTWTHGGSTLARTRTHAPRRNLLQAGATEGNWLRRGARDLQRARLLEVAAEFLPEFPTASGRRRGASCPGRPRTRHAVSADAATVGAIGGVSQSRDRNRLRARWRRLSGLAACMTRRIMRGGCGAALRRRRGDRAASLGWRWHVRSGWTALTVGNQPPGSLSGGSRARRAL
jgi:hypothetical protein